MVVGVIYTKEEEDDITTYTFEISGVEIIFTVVAFSSIEEFRGYDGGMFDNEIFDDVKTIAGYSWEFAGETNELNFFLLMRTLEFLGKEYAFQNKPDIIFYEAENVQLREIYKPPFDAFDYKHITDFGGCENYIFRHIGSYGKDNKKEQL